MCNAHIIIYVMTPDPKEKSQTKSKKRVRDHGEVFTAEREVKAMCDLVKDETQRIDSRFLEPACGDGNFLAEILKRKLAVVRKKYGKRAADYEKNAVLAVSSVYGIDILADNVQACRARLDGIWEKEYEDVCKKSVPEKVAGAVRFILARNIVHGNALTMCEVNEEGEDTKVPIVFSEWSFITGDKMQRNDYTLAALMAQQAGENKGQLSLFAQEEGDFIKRYIADYREVQNNGAV